MKVMATFDLDQAELSRLQGVLAESLPAAEAQRISALLEGFFRLIGLLTLKNQSIKRLRRLIFGTKSEKKAKVLPKESVQDAEQSNAERTQTPQTAPDSGAGESTATTDRPAASRKGHGRHGADAHPGAERVWVPVAGLSSGSPCPCGCGGKLYPYKPPGVEIRFRAQMPFTVTIYELERLRSPLCGHLVTAQLPEEAGSEKYDASVGVHLAMLRFLGGMPMHRLEMLQDYGGVTFADATQWEILARTAEHCLPAYAELVRQGAQGEVVITDDTTNRILKLAMESQAERTGVFTTGIVCEVSAYQVALFFTGWRHAGENLGVLLEERESGRAPPIQMSDALSRNFSESLATVVAKCLTHARRKFVELVTIFPEECRVVLDIIGEVYGHDATAKEQGLDSQQRLAYHQEHSGPLMAKLESWLAESIEKKQVEPNSALGKAIEYMRRHWDGLTCFLREPGAPLDTNLVERALKLAIRHRRSSLFFRTSRGALVGDVFLSLIHTCRLNEVSPLAYLTALERHAQQVEQNPELWLPWNFEATLARLEAAAPRAQEASAA